MNFITAAELQEEASVFDDNRLDITLTVEGGKAVYTVELSSGRRKVWLELTSSSNNKKALLKRLNKAIATLDGELNGR